MIIPQTKTWLNMEKIIRSEVIKKHLNIDEKRKSSLLIILQDMQTLVFSQEIIKLKNL